MENNYGEEFRNQRERWGLKQKDVASEIGLKSPTLSLRECGERKFKAIELYMAYTKLGIDIGFGEVFDYIDHGDLENIPIKMPKRVKENIESRDYKKISLKNLEMIKELLLDKKAHLNKESCEGMETQQEIRLKRILKKYQERDGNILKAIKLLEIAMQQ